MSKTRTLLLCFGLLFSLSSVSADEGKCLLLKLNGAETVSVNLKKTPQYWVKGDFLFLKTPEEVQQFEVGKVQEIVFQDGFYSGVSSQNSDGLAVYPTLTTDYVNVSGAETDNIRIIAVDGKTMVLRAERVENGARLNVSDYPAGVYYLTYGGKTFKFIKGQVVR